MFLPEVMACPQCSRKPTARLRRDLHMCMTCGFQWMDNAIPAHATAISAQEPPAPEHSQFTARELRRLSIYRAAILAGFYSDHQRFSSVRPERPSCGRLRSSTHAREIRRL